MRGIGLRLAALLMAFAMAGCAANQNEDGDTPPEILRITVQNDGRITQQPRINLVPVGGGSITILVGRLTTLSSETFTVRRSDLGGTYRLQAQATGGGAINSPIFSVRGNEQVFWDMPRNTVSVRPLGDSDPGS